jgi:hypothetical protein
MILTPPEPDSAVGPAVGTTTARTFAAHDADLYRATGRRQALDAATVANPASIAAGKSGLGAAAAIGMYSSRFQAAVDATLEQAAGTAGAAALALRLGTANSSTPSRAGTGVGARATPSSANAKPAAHYALGPEDALAASISLNADRYAILTRGQSSSSTYAPMGSLDYAVDPAVTLYSQRLSEGNVFPVSAVRNPANPFARSSAFSNPVDESYKMHAGRNEVADPRQVAALGSSARAGLGGAVAVEVHAPGSELALQLLFARILRRLNEAAAKAQGAAPLTGKGAYSRVSTCRDGLALLLQQVRQHAMLQPSRGELMDTMALGETGLVLGAAARAAGGRRPRPDEIASATVGFVRMGASTPSVAPAGGLLVPNSARSGSSSMVSTPRLGFRGEVGPEQSRPGSSLSDLSSSVHRVGSDTVNPGRIGTAATANFALMQQTGAQTGPFSTTKTRLNANPMRATATGATVMGGFDPTFSSRAQAPAVAKASTLATLMDGIDPPLATVEQELVPAAAFRQAFHSLRSQCIHSDLEAAIAACDPDGTGSMVSLARFMELVRASIAPARAALASAAFLRASAADAADRGLSSAPSQASVASSRTGSAASSVIRGGADSFGPNGGVFPDPMLFLGEEREAPGVTLQALAAAMAPEASQAAVDSLLRFLVEMGLGNGAADDGDALVRYRHFLVFVAGMSASMEAEVEYRHAMRQDWGVKA